MKLEEFINGIVDKGGGQEQSYVSPMHHTDSDWYGVKVQLVPRMTGILVADIATQAGMLIGSRVSIQAFDRELDSQRDVYIEVSVAGRVSMLFSCHQTTILKNPERFSEIRGLDKSTGTSIERTLEEFLTNIPFDLSGIITSLSRILFLK